MYAISTSKDVRDALWLTAADRNGRRSLGAIRDAEFYPGPSDAKRAIREVQGSRTLRGMQLRIVPFGWADCGRNKVH